MKDTSPPILQLRAASKTYDGIYAIKDVTFSLARGEIHALVGENGAGKSTMCKILAGVTTPTSGQLMLDGEETSFGSPSDALRRGIAMVYQETSLVPGMTVAQNIMLGKEKFLNRIRGIYISAQQLLRSMNFHVDPTKLVSQLTAAQKQMVEIARAVYHEARVVIFDEPTATLTPEEKFYFFALARALKEKGVSIIFISHALEEALEMSDTVSVLRDGQMVITSPTAAMTREALIRHMVGRDLATKIYHVEESPSSPTTQKAPPVLRVENVVYGNTVKNMSFSAYAGEVTGIGGLIGSGRTEVAKVIAGEVKRNWLNGGMIYLNGKSIRYRLPRQAIRDGIAYVTEDRKLNGFFETMNIAENIYIGKSVAREGRRLLHSSVRQSSVAQEWIDRLQIRAISRNVKVKELSGGNQQKVVIVKSLVQKPNVIIFDEPTRGVDVGAIEEIHLFIRKLARDGATVIVISSYLPELLSLTDRILVAKQGRIVEEFATHLATEEKIMHAAIH